MDAEQRNCFDLKLSKEIEKIIKAQNEPIRANGIVNCFYRFLRIRHVMVSDLPPSDNLLIYETIYYDARARNYFPLGVKQKLPIILFFHGGGFVMHYASSVIYHEFCRRLALELPCVVLSINYHPHAPKHKCPKQYEAASTHLTSLDQNWFDNGYYNYKKDHTDLSQVFLIGDDAGANIAHHLAIDIASNKIVLTNFKIKGLISIQPLFGGEERTESEILLSKSPMLTLKQRDGMWKSFLPDDRDRDCKEVNVSGPNNPKVHLQGFPRTLVIVGGLDPLQDWQKRYYIWLKECGVNVRLVQYPKAIPQFHLYPELSESTLLINEVRSFVNTMMDQSGFGSTNNQLQSFHEDAGLNKNILRRRNIFIKPSSDA